MAYSCTIQNGTFFCPAFAPKVDELLEFGKALGSLALANAILLHAQLEPLFLRYGWPLTQQILLPFLFAYLVRVQPSTRDDLLTDEDRKQAILEAEICEADARARRATLDVEEAEAHSATRIRKALLEVKNQQMLSDEAEVHSAARIHRGSPEPRRSARLYERYN
jgi:hypothetical protein